MCSGSFAFHLVNILLVINQRKPRDNMTVTTNMKSPTYKINLLNKTVRLAEQLKNQ